MNGVATTRQLNKLSKLTNTDTTSVYVNVAKANNLIEDALLGLDVTDELLRLGAKRKPPKGEISVKGSGLSLETFKIKNVW